ncbi:YbhN family protein [Terrabacter sp. BE26]|uniref:lysylphosphatidylglycerol synthase transmembrane domain-containing protein n=1 Tax=Terrabacter sp. BE26 TaxID=2898152 RepID=UPI0035BE1F0B
MGWVRRWVRPLGVLALAGVLAWRVGPTAVAQAWRQVDAATFGLALAASVAVAGVSTVCVAWRWVLIARGLGLALTLPDAVAASYRAQFLNVTLPAGVAGDVHRAVTHGRAAGDVARGAYAVVCERAVGQAVQVGLALAALAIVPSPLRWPAGPSVELPGAVGGAVAGAVVVGLGMRACLRRNRSRADAAPGDARYGLRRALLSPRVWPAAVVLSLVAVVGHVGTFLLAARAAGVAAVSVQLVPVAFVVLLAAAVPVSLAGWGPREGAAAWAFGVSGLGADRGLVVAAVYGALVMVASLPGAAVLLHARRRRGCLPVPTSVGRAHA